MTALGSPDVLQTGPRSRFSQERAKLQRLDRMVSISLVGIPDFSVAPGDEMFSENIEQQRHARQCLLHDIDPAESGLPQL